MKKTLRIATFVLILGLVTGGTWAAGQPWYVDYENAIKSIDRGNPELAESTLRDLIQRLVVPRENARTYGVWRTDYTPYYYLGVALERQGRYEEATKAFEIGLKFGVVQRDARKLQTIEAHRERYASASTVARRTP